MYASLLLDFGVFVVPLVLILLTSRRNLSELGTFEWWIAGLMLYPLFFSISRLFNACSAFVINLQIN